MSLQRRCHTRRITNIQALAGSFFLAFLVAAHGAEVSLAWDPAEGTEIEGYRVHYGPASGTYDQSIDVGNSTAATVPELAAGTTYYFAVTARDSTGLESLPSNEVSVTPAAISFASLRGGYSGLASASASTENAYLTVDLAATGRFTGQLFLGTSKYSVKGSFNDSGEATINLPAPGIIILLQLDPVAGAISASVSHGTASTDVLLTSGNADPEDLALLSGKYTALIGQPVLTTGEESSAPAGWGYALLKITKTGAVRFRGRMADGQIFSAGSHLDPNSRFIVHDLVYPGNSGLLVGSVSMRDIPGISDGDGTFWWSRPQTSKAAALSGTVSVLASRWVKTPLLQALRATSATPYHATLAGGGLPEPGPTIEKDLSVGPGNRFTITNPADDRLRLGVSPKTGLLRGSFVHPADQRQKPIQGVVFAKQGSGAGFFPGIGTGGSFELTAGTSNAP